MKNDLISREALRKAFHYRIKFFNKSDWDKAMLIIDTIPAVEERPHGKWIKESKLYGGFGDSVLVITCSECGKSFIYHENPPKFCIDCGADMRGDVNDE